MRRKDIRVGDEYAIQVARSSQFEPGGLIARGMVEAVEKITRRVHSGRRADFGGHQANDWMARVRLADSERVGFRWWDYGATDETVGSRRGWVVLSKVIEPWSGHAARLAAVADEERRRLRSGRLRGGDPVVDPAGRKGTVKRVLSQIDGAADVPYVEVEWEPQLLPARLVAVDYERVSIAETDEQILGGT